MNKNPTESKYFTRRSVLGSLGALSISGLLAGCNSGGSTSKTASPLTTDTDTNTTTTNSAVDTSTSTSTTSTNTAGSCTLVPEETAGPYPLFNDLGSALNTIYREDMTEDRVGIPMQMIINLIDVNNNCEPIPDAYVYLWHCDKDGAYSGYSSSQNGDYSDATFLRGVYLTDANGQVDFSTIYPGWYPGRITHMHFRVYLSGGTSSLMATSQIAFPQTITQAVYNSPLYTDHGQNTSVSSFSRDNIFSDGTEYQMATVTGNATDGYTAVLKVGISL